MSTANFETMRDFPLYAKDYNDDYDSYIEVPLIEEDLADINYDLMFHKIQVKGGNYCGIQLYVEVEHDLEEEDYSNDDCHYYFDCCRSVAYRKYQAEVRKINRLLATLGKKYDFQEYVCTARFSNGEAWFGLASNPRSLLKSVFT